MLYTKCILKEKEESDGVRISIMNRHTLNDGKTLDLRISEKSYDEWMQELSPPSNLLGDYYKRRLSWEDFEKRYKEYLQNKNIEVIVRKLAIRSIENDITILCIEDNPEFCHRRILAEECKKYEVNLKILHR